MRRATAPAVAVGLFLLSLLAWIPAAAAPAGRPNAPAIERLPEAPAPAVLDGLVLADNDARVADQFARLPEAIGGRPRHPEPATVIEGGIRRSGHQATIGPFHHVAVYARSAHGLGAAVDPPLVLGAIDLAEYTRYDPDWSSGYERYAFYPSDWTAGQVVAAAAFETPHRPVLSLLGLSVPFASGRDGDLCWAATAIAPGLEFVGGNPPDLALSWGSAEGRWLFVALAPSPAELDALLVAFAVASEPAD